MAISLMSIKINDHHSVKFGKALITGRNDIDIIKKILFTIFVTLKYLIGQMQNECKEIYLHMHKIHLPFLQNSDGILLQHWWPNLVLLQVLQPRQFLQPTQLLRHNKHQDQPRWLSEKSNVYESNLFAKWNQESGLY